MLSIAKLFGLQGGSPLQPPQYYTAFYLSWAFFFAFAVTTSRPWKVRYGLDHQNNPREDLTKYGPAAVSAGKMTQKQLDQLKRVESTHANSMEHFPVFAAALIFAQVANLRPEILNAYGLAYIVARHIYALCYIFIDGERLAGLRGLAWWATNVVCLRLIYLGGLAINGKGV